ncbi:argininosuccinate lyase [Achromobacter aloeverae]|uniref:Argininosuccinate lyase n=1 Tax=Achromobacter aloeverae TaxID=1750518 RepID=A0A4Q1HQM9_9BURK|nr:argininosuccinate lyase [Achromobacter aloeverae]RXN93388.1 argininosuccinate lyase [Achromobacter aloeverae]
MTTTTTGKRALVEARLDAPAADALVAFYEAPHLARELRQFDEYLRVDLAHTVMLAERKVLDPSTAGRILAVLREIRALGPQRFPVDARRGSFLLQVEDYLFSRIGEAIGGRMHTGRSRLDQGPTVRRMYKRGRLVHAMDGVLALQRVLLALASRHAATVMPGYTCLQHAHPAVFGHYILSFADKLSDDFARLRGAWERVNLSPLGAAGLSGTAWPIDRDRTAALLGFEGLVGNAKLAREAYYAAEVASALSFVMSTLNDLATDLHIWSSHEFGFIETADEFCGTSSIFPQKKNPAGLEAVRFAAGEAVTWLASALATFRAEGTGDVVMREVPLLDNAFDSTMGSLALMAAIMESVEVRVDRMAAAASSNWSTATNLADELVRQGRMSFRQAHSVVARLVRDCLAAGIACADVTGEMLARAGEDLGESGAYLPTEIVRDSLDPVRFVATRTSAGGTAPGEIDKLARLAQRNLREAGVWLDERKRMLATADTTLEAAVDQWVAAAG